MSAQFRIQRFQDLPETLSAAFAAPTREVPQTLLKLLACGAKLYRLCAFASVAPAKLEPEKVKTVSRAFREAIETHDARFLRRERQVELAQSFRKRAVESLRVFLIFEEADEIIRVTAQVRRAATMLLHDCFEPQIKDKVQIDVGKHRRYDTTNTKDNFEFVRLIPCPKRCQHSFGK